MSAGPGVGWIGQVAGDQASPGRVADDDFAVGCRDQHRGVRMLERAAQQQFGALRAALQRDELGDVARRAAVAHEVAIAVEHRLAAERNDQRAAGRTPFRDHISEGLAVQSRLLKSLERFSVLGRRAAVDLHCVAAHDRLGWTRRCGVRRQQRST